MHIGVLVGIGWCWYIDMTISAFVVMAAALEAQKLGTNWSP